MIILKLSQRSRSQWPVKGTRHSVSPRCTHKLHSGFPPRSCKRYALDTIILKTMTRKLYKKLHHPKTHSHTKAGNPTSKNIEYMPQNWCRLKKLGQRSMSHWPNDDMLHSIIPRCINTTNNTRDLLRKQLILKTRSEVNVTVTHKWFKTVCHPKIHAHTKNGILTSKNEVHTGHNYSKH